MKKLPKAPIVKGLLLRMRLHLGAMAILGLMQPVQADITGEIHATTGTTGQTITGESVFDGPATFNGSPIRLNYWWDSDGIATGSWDGQGIFGEMSYSSGGTPYSGGIEFNYGYSSGYFNGAGWSQSYETSPQGLILIQSENGDGRHPWQTGEGLSHEYYVSKFAPTHFWFAQRNEVSPGVFTSHFAYSRLSTSGSTPGIAHYLESAQNAETATLHDAYYSWHRSAAPMPSHETFGENIAARSTLAMSFGGANNILKVIHPTNASNFIELNPNSGTISINGQSVLTSASANLTYLTITQAESGYVKNDSANGLPVGERQALTPNGLPIGLNSYAEENAVSIGIGAGKAESLPASGLNSVSLGIGAHAGELSSIAIGDGASATNDGAIAIGNGAAASEGGSVAIGTFAIANQNNQVVLGSYNLPSAPSSTSSPTDDLFVIGNGGVENRSNAFVIKRNGDTQVTGKIKVQGEASFQQVVRVAPAGDIGMGEFTSGPQP